MMGRSSRAFAGLLLTLAACNRPTKEGNAAISSDPIAASTTATPNLAPSTATSATVTAAPVASKATGPCTSDPDCAFDDPCLPSKCVRGAAVLAKCDESSPKPGTCECAEGTCTLRRKDPATGAKKTGCTAATECAFDAATGSCAAGKSRALVDRGGYCACSAGTCTPGFVEPVACKTSADCSWTTDPFRPVPSSKVPRPPGKPCGYSRSTECRDGFCKVTVWKC